jgi:transmembrane sensor
MSREELELPVSNLPRAEAEATRWLVLRRDGDFSAHDERAYRVWLDADPSHRAAVVKVERYWQLLGDIGEDPEIMALTEQRTREAHRPVRVRRTAALAACLVGALALGWSLRDGEVAGVTVPLLGSQAGLSSASLQDQAFRTSVGQRTTVTLADGSIVTLDTDSVLRTRRSPNERLLSLERGRAYFKVAKDKRRPFIVTAGDKTVVATGTEFSVDVDVAAIEVTLVEGSVRVEAPTERAGRAQRMELKPGWKLTAVTDSNARWRTTKVDVERVVSWTSGRLHFFNESLGYAVDEMNRYSEKKIVIRDPDIARQPIVGNFRAGDIDAFVRAVSLHGFARIESENDDVVELGYADRS